MISRKLKCMKIATAIKGTDSLLLFSDKFAMEYFPAMGVVEVVSKNKKECFIIPLTNTAYMVPADEQEAPKTARNSKKD